jgi:hypothetical protein
MEQMTGLKLFMILLGCKPKGRYTEQHDLFFAVGTSVADLKMDIADFWPEADGKIHIDAWREVTKDSHSLFFVNLGGYKKGEFDELHYKMLIVAQTLAEASQRAKETTFYKHMGFEGAVSHIDDKYGVDIDDAFNVEDVLSPAIKSQFHIDIVADNDAPEDVLHLGYLPLSKV